MVKSPNIKKAQFEFYPMPIKGKKPNFKSPI
jgi:hypothetical protein